ncbi:hypothetical protein INT43_007324 [Umbelopsis isabellina]|uniref:Zn(2)-C6 fungal-type domain-containing protein n=1 Tax=Mortierella isabellina TaxID=91625 RepID=A0A8H7UKN9_MORIS|nr:hypothetical protein INT43_007324 [Umbelopsis isabellina]
MYNQNENVPLVWPNAARRQNDETYRPDDEALSQSPDYGQPYMPIGAYEEYSRYGTGTEPAQPDMGPERSPIVIYPMSQHHPNWDPYRSPSGTPHFTAAAHQSLYQHPGSGRSTYQPYEARPHTQQPSQFTTAESYWATPYYNNSEYSHQSRSHSTPPFYPNLDSGEMTAGVAKPPPYVIKACASCKASHVACDPGRPCQRCLRLGKADTCVDAKRKKRGRPKNSSKSQSSQPPAVTTDSAGSSSTEATPITMGQSQEPPDQLLELNQLLGEYAHQNVQKLTPSEQSSTSNIETHSGASSGQRKITAVSPSTYMQTAGREGQSSIRKQKSLPSSMAVRRGSSTSPVGTPKRRNSHRSTEDVSMPIQPIMLQHHQSVHYPGSQHRQIQQTLPVQDLPSLTGISPETQGYHHMRTSAQTQMPSSSTSHARAIHPLSTQFTFLSDDGESEHQNIHHHQ